MKIDYISSDGIHRSEKVALERVHAVCNAAQFSQKWHGFAGFELIDRDTRDREIDLVLLTQDRILLIEMKDWRGSISSQGDQWYLNGDSRGRSPVKVTSGKARLLHSRVKKRLRRPMRDVSVEYRVVLCGEADSTGVPDDEKPLVCSLPDFLKICNQGAYERAFRSTQGRYIREHDEQLEDCLPIPLWSPTRDDVSVDFCELYRLPPRQSRLTEFGYLAIGKERLSIHREGS